ncbi:acyl-CoA dehydrogenase family protein [Actinacidiphila sp. bgisy145]|uniref:acyl-CoA dehydrogenase family protein n=1 Tax=Actinacidiphila sp. bgisy145 TaxID=3413792 RepID=UPI003EBB0FDD
MNTTAATPSLQQARAAFSAVLAEFADKAGERDLNRDNPVALVRALADTGFGRLRVPVELGGFGVDLPTLFELLAQAGEADSNVPQILRGHFTTVEILRHAEDRDTAAHWLRKVAAGAVFGNAQSEHSGPAFETTTRVESVDGQHLVSGTKFYSTGSLYADYIRVAVADDEGNRWFAVVPARHPGVAHLDDWDGIGQRLTGSGTTVFDRVPVAEHGELGRYKEDLRSLNSFVQLVHLANLTGIARSLVAETAEVVRARSRTSLHALSGQAATDPDVLGVVGRLYAHRFTADALLRQVSEALEAAEAADTPDAFAQAYVDTSAAQVALVDTVLEAANLAFHAGGSSAVRERAHLDRHWRNARTLASHNPVVYKPRVIGDFVVNGAGPVNGYDRGRASAAADN